MKDGLTRIFILFALLFAHLLSKSIGDKREHKEIVRNQEVIIDLLQERQVMDSITAEHVENCLWLGKDHVEVGYDGYLRTTYINGYASK